MEPNQVIEALRQNLGPREWWTLWDLTSGEPRGFLYDLPGEPQPRIKPAFGDIPGVDTRELIEELERLGMVRRLGPCEPGLFGGVWSFDWDLWERELYSTVMRWCIPFSMSGKSWNSIEPVAEIVAAHYGVTTSDLQTTTTGDRGWPRDCLVYMAISEVRCNPEYVAGYIGWESHKGTVRRACTRVRKCLTGPYTERLWNLRCLLSTAARTSRKKGE